MDHRVRAELLATFRTELAEHCQALTRTFLSLEKEHDPARQRPLLDEAFRSAHSLKGAARAVAITPIETLAHGLESVLNAARRGDLQLTPSLFDLLYASIDLVNCNVDDDGVALVDQAQVDDLLRQIEVACASAAISDTNAAYWQPSASATRRMAQKGSDVTLSNSVGLTSPATTAGETVRLPVPRLDRLSEQLGELIVPRLDIEEAAVRLATLRDRLESWVRDWRQLRPGQWPPDYSDQLANASALMRFLERNEQHLTHFDAELNAIHAQLTESIARLGGLIDELQSDVKLLRMVPFRTIAESLERVVRDLARALGKEARLILVDPDTALDRHVLEEIKDPLLHLIRNAIDHGIEPPAERLQARKPDIGRVVVAVAQRDGTVTVEVEDDGAGIDLNAVRSAAERSNLVPPADLERASERDLLHLIFVPGLSSRDDVSMVSGRGIGLDVVARSVQRLGGRIEVETTPGVGTRFILTLPVTLATARAVLVEVGDQRYALPTTSVERAVQVGQVGSVGGRPVIEYDGNVLPAAWLAGILERHSDENTSFGEARTAIVLGVGAQRAALLVDRVVDEQEIFVKPLGYPLDRVRFIAGATILGSGRVVPVLNTADLIRAVQTATATATRPATEKPEPGRRRVLIAEDSHTTRMLERYILEAAGYEVDIASDGAEALRIVEERGCDILVSDVDMPVLDGIALTARLRQNPRFRELPIILVTSLDSDEDRERGLQAGADAYIVKSAFNQDYLLRTIRELL